ncbi:MAG: polysaccharide deacetylase [Lachnospiraceae bacterium]|nr:polysaccharide deacetylase [Lachnospiraceae bacterium]
MEENTKINKTEYNRKNVDFIKKMLIAVFVIMFAVPVLLCIYLMIRLNSLERKLDEISLKTAAGASNITVTETVADNIRELDMTAASQLEIYDNDNTYLASGINGSSNTQISTNGDAEFDDTYIEKDGKEEDNSTVLKKNAEPNGKKVYLTFDDGPSVYSNEILDILAENDVKATFFVVHYSDEDLLPVYNRIVDEGHTLAMHSYTHIYREIYADEEAFEKDVLDIHDFLYEQTGYDCKYYRFPGGSSNHVSNVDMQECMKFLDEQGIVYYDWNALSNDAVSGNLTPNQLNSNIMQYVRNNEGDSVVLMHDLNTTHATVEALQDLIDTLKAEGYEICAIDEDTTLVQHVKYEPDIDDEDDEQVD